MTKRPTNSDRAQRTRTVATVLTIISVGSFLFLFVAGFKLDFPDTEFGLWIRVPIVFLPFVTLFALAIQVWRLMVSAAKSKRSLDPMTRSFLLFLGPIGFLWAVFLLTRPPYDVDSSSGEE